MDVVVVVVVVVVAGAFTDVFVKLRTGVIAWMQSSHVHIREGFPWGNQGVCTE